jgi:nucleotide-binding universal stress UspA family protein
MKNILVATDGSEDAARAVAFAAELANQYSATLIIANVIGNADFPGDIFQQMSSAQHAWLNESLSAESARVLKTAREEAQAAGVAEIELESRRGNPAPTIIAIAEDHHADAIVIGKRGQGQLQGLLLGSVSQKLASLAGQVVIVVP